MLAQVSQIPPFQASCHRTDNLDSADDLRVWLPTTPRINFSSLVEKNQVD